MMAVILPLSCSRGYMNIMNATSPDFGKSINVAQSKPDHVPQLGIKVMRTLWVQVTQIKSTCSCSSCLLHRLPYSHKSAANTFTSHVTRKDTFALFCSSALAAAAVADSHQKHARLHEWERIIDETKEHIRDVDEQQGDRLKLLSMDAPDLQRESSLGRLTWDVAIEWAKEQFKIRRNMGFESLTGISLRVLRDLSPSQLDEAIRTNTMLRHAPPRARWNHPGPITYPWTLKKLKTMEWSIAKLACRLLYRISSTGGSKTNESGATENATPCDLDHRRELSKKAIYCHERIIDLNMTIEADKLQDFPSPPNPNYHSGSSRYQRSLDYLNESLHDIFQLLFSGENSLYPSVAEICHTLLTASVPPDASTFHLLAKNFLYAGRDDLVHLVLSSMYETRTRSSPKLLCVAMHFYMRNDDVVRFNRLVWKMRGFRQGLTLANPHVRITPATLERYRFLPAPERSVDFLKTVHNMVVYTDGSRAIEHPDIRYRVVSKARLNLDVYSYMIHGSLKILGDVRAMATFIDMVAEGYAPRVKVCLTLLQHFCKKRDWLAGSSLWGWMQELPERLDQSVYRWMLKLCSVCQRYSAFWEQLVVGNLEGILLKSVFYFPEQIISMDVDALFSYSDEQHRFWEQRNFWERQKIKIPLRLKAPTFARRLGVLGFKLARIADSLEDIQLDAGLSPVFSQRIGTEIRTARQDLLEWIGVSSPTRQDIKSTINPPKRQIFPQIDHLPITHTMRYPTLQSKIRALLEYYLHLLGSLISYVARSVGNVEIHLRHAPTIGHMLSNKMRLLHVDDNIRCGHVPKKRYFLVPDEVDRAKEEQMTKRRLALLRYYVRRLRRKQVALQQAEPALAAEKAPVEGASGDEYLETLPSPRGPTIKYYSLWRTFEEPLRKRCVDIRYQYPLVPEPTQLSKIEVLSELDDAEALAELDENELEEISNVERTE